MSAYEVTVTKLPRCSFCTEPARYDFNSLMGQWAYGCSVHYGLYRVFETLGSGKGQQLILADPK